MFKSNQNHTPVLLEETLRYLKPVAGESYLDATAGYGGHAGAVLARTKNPGLAVLIDRDPQADAVLKQRFAREARTIGSDFLSASEQLSAEGRRFDMILADLGVSSPQLQDFERGFAIKRVGPLDMRMDPRQKITAWQIVNESSEAEMTRILRDYGQEPKARFIAKQIILSRPVESTEQLAAIAKQAWPGKSRTHPATRTFQALRIAVNDELSQLEKSLPIWLQLLKPGGRLAVISFHSLEDGIVKHFLAEHSAKQYSGELEILTAKPVSASPQEIVSNPRARSAKLRAAAKIKNQQKGS